MMTPGVTNAPFSEAMPLHPKNADEVIAVNLGSSVYTLTGSITGGDVALDAGETAILVYAGSSAGWYVTWRSATGAVTYPVSIAHGGTGADLSGLDTGQMIAFDGSVFAGVGLQASGDDFHFTENTTALVWDNTGLPAQISPLSLTSSESFIGVGLSGKGAGLTLKHGEDSQSLGFFSYFTDDDNYLLGALGHSDVTGELYIYRRKRVASVDTASQLRFDDSSLHFDPAGVAFVLALGPVAADTTAGTFSAIFGSNGLSYDDGAQTFSVRTGGGSDGLFVDNLAKSMSFLTNGAVDGLIVDATAGTMSLTGESGAKGMVFDLNGSIVTFPTGSVDLGSGGFTFKDAYLSGNLDAATYSVGGTPGDSGTITAASTVTVVNGLVTVITP